MSSAVAACCKSPEGRRIRNTAINSAFRLRTTRTLRLIGLLPLEVAAAEWAASGYHGRFCNDLADLDDVYGVTRAINGGLTDIASSNRRPETVQGHLARRRRGRSPGDGERGAGAGRG